MSKFDASLFDGADSSGDFGSTVSPGEFNPSSNLFSSAADIFAGAAVVTSTATLQLSNSTNLQTLIASVDVGDLTETYNSSTSYTITDPSTNISLQVNGTDFTSELADGYTYLTAGVITGFVLSQDGTTVATGSGYSISTTALTTAFFSAVSDDSALPLLQMWLKIPTTISGTAAAIATNETFLKSYAHGGFEIVDSADAIQNALSELIADHKYIGSISITNGATTAIALTAAQATTDASLLAKITGSEILEVEAKNGIWTTTGHGRGLTIEDIAGTDRITGGAGHETFVFGNDWGKAALFDFYEHRSGVNHDVVSFTTTEFPDSGVSLLADAKASGTSLVITAGTDRLTFVDMTKAELKTAIAAGDFTFGQ